LNPRTAFTNPMRVRSADTKMTADLVVEPAACPEVDRLLDLSICQLSHPVPFSTSNSLRAQSCRMLIAPLQPLRRSAGPVRVAAMEGLWVKTRSLPITLRLASLRNTVGAIIRSGALEHMRGITAGRIVAPMQSAQVAGVFARREKEGDAVRCDVAIQQPERSIAPVEVPSLPRPAFVRSALINLRPKPMGVLWGELRKFTMCLRHGLNLPFSLCLGSVSC